jgi:hypothetical protein
MRILITSVMCYIYILGIAQVKIPSGQIALQDIDNLDSIILDLANASLNGKTIALPLYIKTDDDINALDFSFKFNETKIELDTIIKQGTFEMTYFLNPNDRKLRLTSYSVSDYKTDKKILTLYFNILGNNFDDKEIFNISGFLNGDGCPIKITAKSFQINSIASQHLSNEVTIYPNPAHEIINMTNAENLSISIFDINGQIKYLLDRASSAEQIDLLGFPSGNYKVNFKTKDGESFSKSFIKN